MTKSSKSTYEGIKGGGSPWPPGLPGGAGGCLPCSGPGLLGIAGAGLPEVGGGGGALEAAAFVGVGLEGTPLRPVPPGLGGDNLHHNWWNKLKKLSTC